MGSAEQPNVLLVMSDEHAPQYSSVYGHPLVVRDCDLVVQRVL